MEEELRGIVENTGNTEKTENIEKIEEVSVAETEELELQQIDEEQIEEKQEEVEQTEATIGRVDVPVEEPMRQPEPEVWRHEPTSPYSPLYVPDRKQSKNNKITLGIVVVLLVMLIAGMIAAVSVLVESAMHEVSTSVSSWKAAFEEFAKGMEEDKVAEMPEELWKYDDFLEEYEEEEEYVQEPYVPNEEDEYYVELADAIREDLSYSVEKHEYEFSDEDMGVNIYVQYASVEGETLAFQDKINEALESGAMYYAKELGASDATDLTLVVKSYVTYMDENTLSVVVDERYSWGYDMVLDLYCMNFDLKTGALLYNTNIIEPSEELAKEFLDMSEYQNGYIEHLDEISLEDICNYFESEEQLILYYTPVGLEIGFNYSDGWVTATLKEYEKFLSKL